MGVADARAVFRLEFRRYLRWRPLRRWLFGWTLLSVLLTLGTLPLAMQGDALRSLGAWVRLLFCWLYVLPTWAGSVVAVLLTQRLACDETRRGELHDLYLTALSPFAIALGKVLAGWTLAGLVMAAVAPASGLVAFMQGASLSEWGGGLLIGWGMLFWVCGAVYRFQWRSVPPLEAVRLYRLRLSAISAALGVLGLIALTLLLEVFSTRPLLSTLPVFHLLPWEAMLHAGVPYPTPFGQIPAWAFLSLFSLVGGLVLTAAGAQWLGWWSLVGYWFQRTAGGALLIATAIVCFASLASQTMFHPRNGEKLFFWGLCVCFALGMLLTRYVLGYYGIPRGQDAFQPIGGMAREWFLFGTLALLTAWTIPAASGVALHGARLTALGVYLGGWLYLIQQVSAGLATTRLETPHSAGNASTRQRVVAEVGHLRDNFGCFTLSVWPAIMISSEPLLRSLFYYPLLITPFGGFLSLDFPNWAYWVYGLYTALLGVALDVARRRRSAGKTG